MASTATASIYDTITNQIIAALERGTGDYTLPWHRSSAPLTRPVNAVTLLCRGDIGWFRSAMSRVSPHLSTKMGALWAQCVTEHFMKLAFCDREISARAAMQEHG